jgi:hypothetical protein
MQSGGLQKFFLESDDSRKQPTISENANNAKKFREN